MFKRPSIVKVDLLNVTRPHRQSGRNDFCGLLFDSGPASSWKHQDRQFSSGQVLLVTQVLVRSNSDQPISKALDTT
jgi:hypothetical protein